MVYRKKYEAPDVVAPEPVIEAKPEAPTVNITWLGEDDLHEGGHGPDTNTWRDITFPKGEAVPISNPVMIEKAKGNRFYSVEGQD